MALQGGTNLVVVFLIMFKFFSFHVTIVAPFKLSKNSVACAIGPSVN
jgi:hypothetical protein